MMRLEIAKEILCYKYVYKWCNNLKLVSDGLEKLFLIQKIIKFLKYFTKSKVFIPFEYSSTCQN